MSAYHQMRIYKRSEQKTAFQTRYNYFKYVMLFKLINALAIFQGYINKIFIEKLDVFVIVYLDNIFIYIKDKGKNYVQAVN